MAKAFQVDTGGTLLTNLLSYYQLESNSTDFFGAVNGADTSITYNSGNGKVNNGAGFSSSRINFGNNFDPGAGAFSVAFWFKSASTGNYQYLFGKSQSSAATSWEVRITNSEKLQANFSVGTDSDSATGATSVTNGAYHLCIVTRDASGGGNITIYLDNVQEAQVAQFFATTISSAFNASAGVDDAAHFAFTGAMDEIGVWSKALSSQERTDLWNAGAGQTMVTVGDTLFAQAVM